MTIIAPLLMLFGLLSFIYGMLMMGAAKGTPRYKRGKLVFVVSGLVVLAAGLFEMASYKREVQMAEDICVAQDGIVIEEGNDVFCQDEDGGKRQID